MAASERRYTDRVFGSGTLLQAVLSAGALLTLQAPAAEPAKTWKFEFDSAKHVPQVFSTEVPEANYRVTVTLGDNRAPADTTVKAELRRLMLESVRTGPGQFVKRTFIVNVRTPSIPGGGEIRLKDREKTSEQAAWDGKLSLEFLGTQPAASSLEITSAPDVPTLFIAGDSTVADQALEPYASWGQMITRFFGPDIAVANHSESGESLASFIGENRLAKLISVIRPGDYLLVQMGHNDQKLKGEGIGPWTSYKAQLKRFISEARAHGATPILVTSMNRRTFDANGVITNSLGDFPDAVRETAREDNVALIDLNAMSKRFYEALGPDRSLQAFAPGDATHHNNYGAYELARCVVESIRSQKLPLARYLASDVTPFDPAKPDPIETFQVLPSTGLTKVKPYGQ